jgi:adenylate kinase family enzyme
VKRVQVITSASGNGGTTLAKELAVRLDVPFHELDALHWQPCWTETPADELRARLAPIVESEAWVIDGNYHGKLGDLILRRADLVVWLDLPMSVWLPRLVGRTMRRALSREPLWNGNRETLRSALWSRDSLLLYALRVYRPRRRRYPVRLAEFPHVRLRSTAEVERFLGAVLRERRRSEN